MRVKKEDVYKRQDPVSAGLDYSDSSCWFEGNRAPRDKKVDIFYVGPTCIWDYTDSSGRRQHHMDVFDPRQRGLVDPSVRLAESVLSDSCNFFSPYYRQISMDSWLSLDTAVIGKRLSLIHISSVLPEGHHTLQTAFWT